MEIIGRWEILLSALVILGSGLMVFSVLFSWWKPAVDWSRPRVLMYHMVSAHRSRARFNKLRVPPEIFERQIRWLAEQDFSFIFASQLCGIAPDYRKTVCLTFDDGYEDNLLNADRILAKYGAVGTLYLVGDSQVGWSSRKKQHHGDDELRNEPKLNDEQVRRMLQSGRWELGGHTHTHANLPVLENSEAEVEIRQARTDFVSRFGSLPATFAYPFGLYGKREVALVRDAGYVAAVTTNSGIFQPGSSLMEIPRVKVSGSEGILSFIIRVRTGSRSILK